MAVGGVGELGAFAEHVGLPALVDHRPVGVVAVHGDVLATAAGGDAGVEAIGADFGFRKASKGTTYSSALVSGTSRPSMQGVDAHGLDTPSALACSTIALRWSMWLCTLPSENRPMKWIVPSLPLAPALAPATISCHASPCPDRSRRRSRWRPVPHLVHTPARHRWRCGRLPSCPYRRRTACRRRCRGHAGRCSGSSANRRSRVGLLGSGNGAAGVVLGQGRNRP